MPSSRAACALPITRSARSGVCGRLSVGCGALLDDPPVAVAHIGRNSTRSTLQQRGDTDEVDEARGLHLGHDLAAMNLDGLLRDADLARDGPVRPPCHDEAHDLALPRGEPCEALAELLALRLGAAHLAVHLESAGDAVEQELAAEGFLDEVDGARLHRPHRRRYVDVSGDHDDGEPDVAAGERALEIEPTHPGQADVGHDAAGTPPVLALQERLRPGKRFDRDVDGAEQVPQAFAHPRVVLDDVALRVGYHGSPDRPAVPPRAGRSPTGSSARSARGRSSRRTFTRTPRLPSQANCSSTRATSAAVASAATVRSSPAPCPARSASSAIVSAVYRVSKPVRCRMGPGFPLVRTKRAPTCVHCPARHASTSRRVPASGTVACTMGATPLAAIAFGVFIPFLVSLPS